MTGDQSTLSSCALDIINQNGASSLSKEGKVESLNSGSVEAKLSADHGGISSAPEVVTDCAPDLSVTQLNTTFIHVGSTHQSEVTISTKTFSVCWHNVVVLSNLCHAMLEG